MIFITINDFVLLSRRDHKDINGLVFMFDSMGYIIETIIRFVVESAKLG